MVLLGCGLPTGFLMRGWQSAVCLAAMTFSCRLLVCAGRVTRRRPGTPARSSGPRDEHRRRVHDHASPNLHESSPARRNCRRASRTVPTCRTGKGSCRRPCWPTCWARSDAASPRAPCAPTSKTSTTGCRSPAAPPPSPASSQTGSHRAHSAYHPDLVVFGAQFDLICAPRPMIVGAPTTAQIGGYFAPTCRLRLLSVTGFAVSLRPRLAEFTAPRLTTWRGQSLCRARGARPCPRHERISPLKQLTESCEGGQSIA
jgi:hypothetical protein